MSVMGFNAGLALQVALVTEKAAIAASRLAGQGDEKAAAALRCVGGQMQGRLHFRNDDEIARARRVGIDQLDTKYDLDGSVQRLRSDRPVKGS